MSRMFTRQGPMVRPEDVTASPPLEVQRRGDGLDFRLNLPPECWAKITGGPSSGAYSWKQQTPAAGGTFIDTPQGLVGTAMVNPAYELSGNSGVAAGTVVKLVLGFMNPSSVGAEWLFNSCCGTGSSSSSSSD